ncbi:hypothetical protein DPM19_07420 [Actinomadura craniellae]|uniref:Uncharacterized protein n=1 Tax=Actinomadura craniellae TaxID=2231787 RepID=A0A365H938_9ACTN|nr:hypothetical protein [Actinomadura craniellae]RAY15615.1 hypothetical protein DPM19_07420 [Actinomadura craniellae]
MTEKPFEQLTEEEEAEYFYANREEFEAGFRPASLARVISTRFSEEELVRIGEAANAAGMKTSTFIRQATLAALTEPPQVLSEPGELAELRVELTTALTRVKKLEKKSRGRARKRARLLSKTSE